MHSLSAEAAVLGSMIVDPDCIGKVLPRLPRADFFFLHEHQIIYEALVKLYTSGIDINGVTLRAELDDQGTLDEVGGAEYLQKILETVPGSGAVVYYCNIVRAKERERALRATVEQLTLIPDEPGTVDEKIERARDAVLQLEPQCNAPDYVSIGGLAREVANTMWDDESVVPTGFRALDDRIGGFRPGELTILAGRPSMGKSALMLGMALNIAKAGVPVLLFTLEMSYESLTKRALCSMACVDMSKLAFPTDDMRMAVFEQLPEIQRRKVLLSQVGRTPAQQIALIRRLRQTHNIGCVFVDYVQLMTLGARTENRVQEMSAISRMLKGVAVQENIPLIALSQLNRQPDSREDHRPRMSDLRESGGLEQDADMVLFVYRPDYYEKDKPDFQATGLSEILIRKNRNGPTGKVELVFVHDYVSFADKAKAPEPVGSLAH
jgi:replicative DNA helicase